MDRETYGKFVESIIMLLLTCSFLNSSQVYVVWNQIIFLPDLVKI